MFEKKYANVIPVTIEYTEADKGSRTAYGAVALYTSGLQVFIENLGHPGEIYRAHTFNKKCGDAIDAVTKLVVLLIKSREDLNQYTNKYLSTLTFITTVDNLRYETRLHNPEDQHCDPSFKTFLLPNQTE